ncbi:MAG: AMMECR1 protein [uncultured bacterium]|nr:MAG: AMMECR1 protein [uncultured bacterium]HBR72050.1 AmmeMemoRadiSam system protein B [Candidatus Moranbacteria bacterium]
MIVFAAIVPHPPESIAGIGAKKDKVKIKKTLEAFEKIREGLEKSKPDTILIISPHAKMENYVFVINSSPTLRGNLAEFGVDEMIEFENDIMLADKVSYYAEMNGAPAHLHENFLDYGAIVPLMHLTKNIKPKVLHLAFSMLNYEKHYSFGQVIGKMCKNSKKRIAVIASGDLSHRLSIDSPAGYSSRARFFDEKIIGFLFENNFHGNFGLDKDFIEEVAECGLRSIAILLGIISKEKYKFHLLNYEGPLGIGYLVARFI